MTPGKAGQDVEGIPVYDTVADAVREQGANTAMIFVPPRFAAEAILEATDAGVRLAVCITEGIPVKDMARVHSYLRGRDTTLVGPNCPGVISPGRANVGIIPGEICAPGRVGLVSRSGTLVYQIVHELTQAGLGQSTCIGMGGDPVHGIGFIESLALFQADPETDLVVMTGEISDGKGKAQRLSRTRDEAGGGLHRRVRGAPGQEDAGTHPDHQWWQSHRKHGGRQGQGPGGRWGPRGAHPHRRRRAGPGGAGMTGVAPPGDPEAPDAPSRARAPRPPSRPRPGRGLLNIGVVALVGVAIGIAQYTALSGDRAWTSWIKVEGSSISPQWFCSVGLLVDSSGPSTFGLGETPIWSCMPLPCEARHGARRVAAVPGGPCHR